ncbi:MAG: hypothetical protein RJA22_2634 [Verrucomicrobiota bacterium]
MSLEQKLLDTCHRWRQLTELERDAIQKLDWRQLAEQQALKLALQQEIDTLLHGAAEPARHQLLRRLQPVVEQLAALERANHATLEQHRALTRESLRQLDQSGHQLRQVRQAYAPAPGAAWHSYS